MTSLGLLIGVGVVAGIVLLIVMTRLLYICQPNEVLIFSGARRVLATGRVVGYQIIKGGRRVRRPLVEAGEGRWRCPETGDDYAESDGVLRKLGMTG